MLSSYETRLMLERMEKEIRFLKVLLGDTSAASTEGWVPVTPETFREPDAARRPERFL